MKLRLRVVSGSVLAAALLAGVWLGGVPFDILLAAAVLLGGRELEGLAARSGTAPLRWLMYPLAAWLAFRFVLPDRLHPLEAGVAAAVVAGMAGSLIPRLGLGRWAVSVGGALYLGLGLGYYPALLGWRPGDAHFGARLMTVTLLAIAACDISAYGVGSAVGRHRFFPTVSPRKTVEGAVAGLVGAALISTLLGPAMIGAAPPVALGLGLVAGVGAQLGDLVESALKREAQVKDSGTIVPGHGGLLDRLDSLLFVGPLVYGYLLLAGVH